MALPLEHTISRNISEAAIKAGKYSNMRIYGISGNMNPTMNWTTPSAAVDAKTFFQFSSTCWYFGESLVDRLGDDMPVGLIHTAWGGSTIEQWLDNETIATCSNATLSKANGEWHETRVLPFSTMTIKGWVWYQVGACKIRGRFGSLLD